MEDQALSFERAHESRLYKVSKEYAVRLSSSDIDDPTLVRYVACSFPISWLCGRYQTSDNVLPGPLFLKEDLIVSARLGPAGAFAINTTTNTIYRASIPHDIVDLNGQTIPTFQLNSIYTKLGFDPGVDAHTPITQDSVAQHVQWPELSVSQEGCLTFNLVFIMLMVGLLLITLANSLRVYLRVGRLSRDQ